MSYFSKDHVLALQLVTSEETAIMEELVESNQEEIFQEGIHKEEQDLFARPLLVVKWPPHLITAGSGP